jgi:conjugative transfer signal peptidase TraF
MSRSMTARDASRLLAALLGATALASALACRLACHLVWNWTPSLPLGLYWLSRGARTERGKLVAFPVPSEVQSLVLERRYLPPGALLVKPVAAMAGDVVCTDGGALAVNGAPLGTIRTTDTAGRPLPHYEGCGPVADGTLFVLSPYDKSFDSRTFGPVASGDIRGTVRPLWTY